jgi:hypothetical protein
MTNQSRYSNLAIVGVSRSAATQDLNVTQYLKGIAYVSDSVVVQTTRPRHGEAFSAIARSSDSISECFGATRLPCLWAEVRCVVI